MRKLKLNLLVLGLALLTGTSLRAYDEVKIDKVLPLADRKAHPTVLRLDRQNQIWIINETNLTLQQISIEGKASVNLNSGKKANALFKTPVDFAFLSNGDMVVADSGLGRLAIIGCDDVKKSTGSSTDVKLDWKKAKLLYSIQVPQPSAVDVSQDDIIAVGYGNQPYIDLFSVDGVPLHRLVAPEKNPIKSISGLFFSADGTLWALDGENGALHRFSSDRKWLGVTSGLETAARVAVDKFGFAYVSLAKGKWTEVNPQGEAGGTFGTKGKNPGEMLSPMGIGVLDTEHVLVCETGNNRLQTFHVVNKSKKAPLPQQPAAHIQVRLLSTSVEEVDAAVITSTGDALLHKSDKGFFEWVDAQGVTKSSWKKKGKGKVGLVHPHSIALDPTGAVWVSDQGDHALKVLSDTGDIVKTLGQKGKKEGNLQSPSFLCIRHDGTIVVVDKGETRIQVLNPDGLFLFSVGTPGKKAGQIQSVAGIAANDEVIAVLDGERKALLLFNSNGKFISEIANKEGKAPYWINPTSISSDMDGRFYILDSGPGRVRIFNGKGQFLADFSAKGNRLACGGDHRVLVMGEKSTTLYSVYLVPRGLKNVTVSDESGEVKISWDPNSEASDYRVYRSSNTLTYTFVTHTASSTAIDRVVRPGVLYTYAVTGLNSLDYEGDWSFSTPFRASKRKDVSLISIEKVDFKPVFTAAFKYYSNKSIGTIEIQNNDDKSFRNVKLSLTLKKYTDFATEMVVEDIEAGERKSVPVTMTFNDKVLELTENTPVQMEIRLSYFEDNQEKSVNQNAPITLYSRNAIEWSDKARISSFITPRDTPIVEFARSAIRAFLAPLKGSTVGKPLAKAALFYESMNALNISYVADPTTPFAEVSGKPETLDYVQFPRETLRRKTGDCDDTTALLSSLLESVGVKTALIDTPGHIFLMADTEESDPAAIGLPVEKFVLFKNTYWVPIETTQLSHDFIAAWQAGISEVKAGQEKNQIEFIPVAEAAAKYQPVTLVEVDKETPAFPEDKVKETFPKILAQLQSDRYLARLKDIQDKIKADPSNHMLQVQLGMIHVEGDKPQEGRKVFESLLKEDEPVEVRSAARNNLGNLAYLEGKYADASQQYEQAAALAPADGGILINRARTAWKLGDNASAKKFLADAQNNVSGWREFAGDLPAELLPK